MVPKRFHVESS